MTANEEKEISLRKAKKKASKSLDAMADAFIRHGIKVKLNLIQYQSTESAENQLAHLKKVRNAFYNDALRLMTIIDSTIADLELELY